VLEGWVRETEGGYMSVARTDKEILCATEVYVNMNQTYLHES